MHSLQEIAAASAATGLRGFFNDLDADMDGTLSCAELRAGLLDLDLPAELSAQIDRLLVSVKPDANGSIDFVEMERWMAPPTGKAVAAARAQSQDATMGLIQRLQKARAHSALQPSQGPRAGGQPAAAAPKAKAQTLSPQSKENEPPPTSVSHFA